MEITRKQIEDEKNYKKLQGIGRKFRKEGHVLILNMPEPELKVKLLALFDDIYGKESEPADPIPVGETAKIEAETIPEPAIEPTPVTKPKKSDVKLYTAPRAFKDWASGWQFIPGMDKPKPLPDTLTPGLENAIKTKKIIPYEG